eukprot:scaffold11103_cov117-Cylindrotheca_fusiformis.AAC.7
MEGGPSSVVVVVALVVATVLPTSLDLKGFGSRNLKALEFGYRLSSLANSIISKTTLILHMRKNSSKQFYQYILGLRRLQELQDNNSQHHAINSGPAML